MIEQPVTDAMRLNYDPGGENLDYEWSDIESAKSYIITAFNNMTDGHVGAACGDLYNALMYVQSHCVKDDKFADII